MYSWRTRASPKSRGQVAEGLHARAQLLLARLVGVEAPEEDRVGAALGVVAQQLAVLVEAGEVGEEQGRVGVVDALLVAFGIEPGGEAADFGEHGLVILGQLGQAGQRQLVAAMHGGLEHLVGQVFGAVDLGRLAHQLLAPEVAGGLEALVLDQLVEVRAGEVVVHPPVAVDGGQFEGLGVDGEAVVAEGDDVVAAGEEVELVAQAADDLVAGALEPSGEVVGLHRLAHVVELGDGVAQLGDHHVGGEVGVDPGDVLEGLGAADGALEDALGAAEHGADAALALLVENLLAGGEGAVGLLALLGELGHVLVVVGELALEFLDGDHDLGEVLVALGDGVAHADVVGDGLADELELGGELGGGLLASQILALAAEGGAGAVHARVDLGDRVHDLGGLGGVLDFQVVHHVGEQVEARGQAFQALAGGVEIHQLRDAGESLRDLAVLLAVRIEGVGPEEELGAGEGQDLGGLAQPSIHLVDLPEVGVAQLAEADGLAAARAQLAEAAHVVVDVAHAVGHLVEKGLADGGGAGGDLLLGGGAQLHDLLELADGGDGGGLHVADDGGEASGLLLGEPEMAVQHMGGGADQVVVGVEGDRIAGGEAADGVALGDGADQLAVADLRQQGVGRRLRLEILAAEGGLPDLHGMDALRLVVRRVEQHHPCRRRRASSRGRRGDWPVPW